RGGWWASARRSSPSWSAPRPSGSPPPKGAAFERPPAGGDVHARRRRPRPREDGGAADHQPAGDPRAAPARRRGRVHRASLRPDDRRPARGRPAGLVSGAGADAAPRLVHLRQRRHRDRPPARGARRARGLRQRLRARRLPLHPHRERSRRARPPRGARRGGRRYVGHPALADPAFARATTDVLMTEAMAIVDGLLDGTLSHSARRSPFSRVPLFRTNFWPAAAGVTAGLGALAVGVAGFLLRP